jgi:hypothetical protein
MDVAAEGGPNAIVIVLARESVTALVPVWVMRLFPVA